MGRKKARANLTQGANAKELRALCAVGTALVMLSPDGKGYMLGQPVELDSGAAQRRAEHEAKMRELRRQYADARKELEAEKRRGEKLKQMRKEQSMCLVDMPINEMDYKDLKKAEEFMNYAKGKLLKRIDELSAQQASDETASSSAASAEAGMGSSSGDGGP